MRSADSHNRSRKRMRHGGTGILQNGGEGGAKNRRIGRKKLPPDSHFAQVNNPLSPIPEKTGSSFSGKGKRSVSRLGDTTVESTGIVLKTRNEIKVSNRC